MTKPKTSDAAQTALQRRQTSELRRLARQRDTTLAWYHEVGSTLKVLAPKSSKRSIETYAAEVFKNEKFATTLYACRKFADAIPTRSLPSLDGLNWAIVHHLIFADDKHRPKIIAKLQRERRRKERIGEPLTPLEARMIVQEIRGKSPIRRAKQSKIPTLGPKSALRETVRLSDDWIRYCRAWLKIVAKRNAQLSKRTRRTSDHAEWLSLIESARSAIKALREDAEEQLRRLSVPKKILKKASNR